MKTKEELNALKEEVETLNKMNEEKKDSELKDEQLEQVTGGSFLDRGHTWSSDYPHKLIVTIFNSCPMYSGFEEKVCCRCLNVERKGIVLYCTKRTYDNDPIENGGPDYHWRG